MSDGPHRSLPLRPHWRKLAERAATPAYSLSDVAEAFPFALKKDFSKDSLRQVREILSGGNLFQQDCEGQLEAARSDCRGSAADNLLIDHAIQANISGLAGDSAFLSALEKALFVYSWKISLQIEEHYLRKQSPDIVNVRERLKAGRLQCSHGALAAEMTSGNTRRISSYRLPKHTGIDEGPPL